VARLVGDQLEQDQPKLARVEDPPPASAMSFAGLASPSAAVAVPAEAAEMMLAAAMMRAVAMFWRMGMHVQCSCIY
jgi:hypothetical protein